MQEEEYREQRKDSKRVLIKKIKDDAEKKYDKYWYEYHYAEAKEDMIAELKELAKKAPDEKTKQELEHFANEMESK